MKRNGILKHLFGVFLLFALFLIQSCSKTDESIDGTDPVKLELSSETLEFDYCGDSTDGLNGKIEVSSNRWWEVVFDSETDFSSWGWSIDCREMEDDGSFTITVPKSYDAHQLIATVKVYNQDGELTYKTVTITQTGPADPIDKEVPISDVIALMGDESACVSEEYNYYFDAVVTAFSLDGTMFVQAQDASAPGDGIAIAADITDALESTYAVGDIVTVTIPAIYGMGLVVNDAPQLTYSTIDLVKGSTTTATPVVISVSDLKSNDYVNMFVAIENASPQEDGGIWTDGDTDGSHIFTVGSDTFTIFIDKNVSDMYKVPFSQETGTASGIGGSSAISGQMIVTQQSQVVDFAFTDPVITSITPASCEFYTDGGSQEFILGGTNLADQDYIITGLGSEFNYTIDSTVEKPVITVSTTNSFISADVAEQTITVTTEDQTITFTVSQKAAVITTGLASNATSSSIDVSGAIQFVSDISSVEVGVEYSASSNFSGAIKVPATVQSATWLATISGLSAETKYYMRAYATSSVSTIYGDSINGTTGAVGSDIPFKTIPEVLSIIREAADLTSTQATSYPGETFKVRGVVCTDIDNYNIEAGYVFITTEGTTEPGNGLGLYVGYYDNHVTSIANLALGDEVIVTLKNNVGMCQGYGVPYISAWANSNISFEETGRNVTIEPIVIAADDYADYYCQAVTFENVTIGNAGTFTTNKNSWITDIGPAIRIANNAASVFNGVSYNAGVGSFTGTPYIYNGTILIYPRNLSDIADFLDASYFE